MKRKTTRNKDQDSRLLLEEKWKLIKASIQIAKTPITYIVTGTSPFLFLFNMWIHTPY